MPFPRGMPVILQRYWRILRISTAWKADHLTAYVSFQAAGSVNYCANRIVEEPETLATAIRIGNPASWKTAIEARDQSKGLIDMVTDEQIIEAYQILAAQDGVFVNQHQRHRRRCY